MSQTQDDNCCSDPNCTEDRPRQYTGFVGLVVWLFSLCSRRRQARPGYADPLDSTYNKNQRLGKITSNITPQYTKLSREIKKSIASEKSESHYSKNLMNMIHESWFSLSTKSYVEMTILNRTERRKIRRLDNLPEYEKFIEESNNQAENI